MELTKEQAEERLNSPSNLANRIASFRQGKKLVLDEESNVLAARSGRNLPRLSRDTKAEIVRRATSGLETQQQIAEAFSLTQGQISLMKSGAEANASSNEKNLIKVENEAKAVAIDKMMLAMNLISPDKLQELKARDLAAIASSLSNVSSGFSKGSNVPLVNLVVYAPEVRGEDSFKIVEIKS